MCITAANTTPEVRLAVASCLSGLAIVLYMALSLIRTFVPAANFELDMEGGMLMEFMCASVQCCSYPAFMFITSPKLRKLFKEMYWCKKK